MRPTDICSSFILLVARLYRRALIVEEVPCRPFQWVRSITCD
jgi:hypothetical protein